MLRLGVTRAMLSFWCLNARETYSSSSPYNSRSCSSSMKVESPRSLPMILTAQGEMTHTNHEPLTEFKIFFHKCCLCLLRLVVSANSVWMSVQLIFRSPPVSPVGPCFESSHAGMLDLQTREGIMMNRKVHEFKRSTFAKNFQQLYSVQSEGGAAASYTLCSNRLCTASRFCSLEYWSPEKAWVGYFRTWFHIYWRNWCIPGAWYLDGWSLLNDER